MYLKLYFHFFKTSLSRVMIFRKNFLVYTFTNFMWLAYYIFSIEIIFRHTDSIAGWSRGEVLLLVATLFFIDGLRYFFFYHNLKNLPSDVTEGNLALILTKPVDSQFWFSLRRVNFEEITLFFATGALWWYALSLTDIRLTIINVFIYIILSICGLLITYSLWFMLVTIAFWYYRIDNITELFNQIIDIGRYPMAIFKGLLRVIVLTIIPLAVITNFPVQALLSKLTVLNLVYALLLTAAFLIGSRWFWLFAIKRYSSASS